MIIKLKGGLGNQMFQYAYGRAVTERSGEKLLLDISGFGTHSPKETPRSYRLGYFNINAEIADQDTITPFHTPLATFTRKLKQKISPKNYYVFDPKELEASRGIYREGFWQTEKYFISIADTIRKELSLLKPLSLKAISAENLILSPSPAVSLHIRRGDYVSDERTKQYHGTCTPEYYQRALEFMKEKIGGFTVCVFSDDIAWAREHLPHIVPAGIKIEYISNPEIPDYEEIILMSLCAHHIIANSSFSWWGAWLNPQTEKIVIAPKQWVTSASISTHDVTPENWVRL